MAVVVANFFTIPLKSFWNFHHSANKLYSENMLEQQGTRNEQTCRKRVRNFFFFLGSIS